MGRRRGQRVTAKNPRKRAGSWVVRWREQVRTIDGGLEWREFSKALAPCIGPGKITKKQADRLAWEQIFSKLDGVNCNPASMVTFAEFVTLKYLPSHEQTWSKAWRQTKRSLLSNHVMPALGEIPMRTMTAEHISGMIRSAALSPKSSRELRGTVSSVFRFAKELGYHQGDLPTEFVRIPRGRPKQRGSLTFDQVSALVEAFPQCADLTLFLAVMGVRLGEALGLRWFRLNLTDRHVSRDGEAIAPYSVDIQDAWVRGEMTDPKTSSSVRQLPLPRMIVERMKARQGNSVYVGDDDFVFASKTGAPFRTDNFMKRHVKPRLRELDLPEGFSLHWLRHTATSFADQVGLSEVERQKGLGHASRKMTMHYSHTERQSVLDGLERIADRLSGKRAGGLISMKKGA